MTHSINFQLAHVKNGFGAPIGETMFLEGLAMHASQKAVPGLPDKDYVADVGQRGWMQRCYANKHAVLAEIKPDLDKRGYNVEMKYTYGDGNTGMHREIYCAAWIVVGQMLKSGRTLADMAHVPENRMVETISGAITRNLDAWRAK